MVFYLIIEKWTPEQITTVHREKKERSHAYYKNIDRQNGKLLKKIQV
jgi:uncharacterized protein with GYD domain